MKILSVLSSVIMASVAGAQTVSSCPGDYPFQLASATLSPYPVVVGQNVSVSASGFLDKGNEVTQGAYYKIQLKLGLVTGNYFLQQITFFLLYSLFRNR